MNFSQQLINLLIEKKLKISAAESCTGGMLMSSLIGVAGSSAVIGASYITYSDEAKINTVGVKADTINNFGVVSENVALEMAKGAADTAGADIGVGITGYAGPAADENDTTVGTVCFGFYIKGKTLTSTKHFGDVGRNVVRELSCVYATDMLIRLVEKFIA